MNRTDSRETNYDLEERTEKFARNVRNFISNVPRTITNIEDCKQLTKSSGSIGANYIEANEHLSEDDFLYRVKVCRKEAKETRYWLKIMDLNSNEELSKKRNDLIQEATELMKIFGSIIHNWK